MSTRRKEILQLLHKIEAGDITKAEFLSATIPGHNWKDREGYPFSVTLDLSDRVKTPEEIQADIIANPNTFFVTLDLK